MQQMPPRARPSGKAGRAPSSRVRRARHASIDVDAVDRIQRLVAPGLGFRRTIIEMEQGLRRHPYFGAGSPWRIRYHYERIPARYSSYMPMDGAAVNRRYLMMHRGKGGPGCDAPEARMTGWVSLAIFCVALVIRLGSTATLQGSCTSQIEAASDQFDYELLTYNLSAGDGYGFTRGVPTASRPPGTPLTFLPPYLLFGRSATWRSDCGSSCSRVRPACWLPGSAPSMEAGSSVSRLGVARPVPGTLTIPCTFSAKRSTGSAGARCRPARVCDTDTIPVSGHRSGVGVGAGDPDARRTDPADPDLLDMIRDGGRRIRPQISRHLSVRRS